MRPECAELAFAAGDLGVVEAADLADDGVDRSWREPSARAAGADRAGGQEQGVAVVVGIAGSFRFEVVSDGVACVAAEEDCAAGAALARTSFSLAFFIRRSSSGSPGSSWVRSRPVTSARRSPVPRMMCTMARSRRGPGVPVWTYPNRLNVRSGSDVGPPRIRDHRAGGSGARSDNWHRPRTVTRHPAHPVRRTPDRIGMLGSHAKCVFNGAQFGQLWPNSGGDASLAVRSRSGPRAAGDPINGVTCPDPPWRLPGGATAVRAGGR